MQAGLLFLLSVHGHYLLADLFIFMYKDISKDVTKLDTFYESYIPNVVVMRRDAPACQNAALKRVSVVSFRSDKLWEIILALLW